MCPLKDKKLQLIVTIKAFETFFIGVEALPAFMQTIDRKNHSQTSNAFLKQKKCAFLGLKHVNINYLFIKGDITIKY